MISDLSKRVGAALGMAGVVAVVIAILLLLPFGVIAVIRLTGWEWGVALAALLALNLIPVAGQVVYVCLAVVGAFTLGQDNLASRTQAVAPAQSVNADSDAAAQFAEWRKTVAAPAVQDSCLQDVQRRGLGGAAQIDQMAKACACYGAAAVSVIVPEDVEDGKLQPTPEFNARLSFEAKRLCQR